MTTTQYATNPVAPQANRWSAVTAVAVGTFLLVTAEQLPIGLLSPVGSALRISEGAAGLVTGASIVAALAAPVVPLVIGRLDRRVLLVALMGLMTVANAISAMAPNFAILLVSRALVGIAIGGFWAVAAGLAVRLVTEKAVPKATAVIFGGVGAANVLGVPLGTAFGALAGWRLAFAALSILALVVSVVLVAVLPPLVATQPLGLHQFVDQFRNHGVRAGILATFLLVIGHFAAYTFVGPTLQQLSGIDTVFVGPLLLGFGIAGIAGNFLAGAALGRALHWTVLGIAARLTTLVLLYPLLGRGPIGAMILLIGWGLVFGGVSVSLQTWMITAAPKAVEAASALWVAVFNLAIGVGALAGGAVVDAVSLPAVLVFAGVLLALATLAVWSGRGPLTSARHTQDSQSAGTGAH
ncbi:MFS transporter [Nocardia pseudovaccinii]|uniref:MFS transporter n=1 Tax=Nocardia pseudovaccinii TaxID=189540 RepID=UPI000A05F266|nr:MFS transporter [Nocardia pseudovaccinii]